MAKWYLFTCEKYLNQVHIEEMCANCIGIHENSYKEKGSRKGVMGLWVIICFGSCWPR